MLDFIIKISEYNFGTFKKSEFKMYLLMGVILALIIGVYWTLKPLKDSIFINLVGKMYLPYAKTLTVIALMPIVILFTKLIERNSKEKMFTILALSYALMILIFNALIYIAQNLPESINGSSLIFIHQIIGYTWYILVESFGPLFVALFWAFAESITKISSANKGFALIVAIAQIGGIALPYNIGGLPHRLGYHTDTLSMIILSAITILIIPFTQYLFHIIPKHFYVSYDCLNNTKKKTEVKHDFLSGIKLLFSNKYLLGILILVCIYEIIITIFDFNFKLEAASKYHGVELTQYLSMYASCVNFTSFILLLFGVSNINRYLGLGTALAIMPIIFSIALYIFLEFSTLEVLFILMVGLKAINYSLNNPAIKQLYIPTSLDAKFKSQAWIETFGTKLSKQTGSILNMTLNPLQNLCGEMIGKVLYHGLICIIGIPLLILWFITALFLNKNYKNAIMKNNIIS